jgi:molybdenum cofactor cytidylyltransferase
MFVIILAAGASTRFGSPKPLALIDGAPMLEHVVRHTLSVARPEAVTVVISDGRPELGALMSPLGVRTIVNREASAGIGTSIRTGVMSLASDAAAAMIALADQPWVTSADYRALVRCWKLHPQCRVASAYAGSCGVPAIFPRADFGALMALRSDRGARQLLLSDPQKLRQVPVLNAAHDVDTPGDLRSPPAKRAL